MSDTANGLLIASGPELSSLGLRSVRTPLGYIPIRNLSEAPSIAEWRHGAATSLLSRIPSGLSGAGLDTWEAGITAASEINMIGSLNRLDNVGSATWIKVASVSIIILLSVGVIGSLISMSPYTTALVPIGFTLWAFVSAAIRSRDSRNR